MKRVAKFAAEQVAKNLKKVLVVEANTNSSVLAYQPKAPKSLDKYKK